MKTSMAIITFALFFQSHVGWSTNALKSRAKSAAKQDTAKKKRIRAPRSQNEYHTWLATRKTKPDFVKVSVADSIPMAEHAVLKKIAEKFHQEGRKTERLTPEGALEFVQKNWSIEETQLITASEPEEHPVTGNATIVVTVQKNGGLFKKFTGVENYVVSIGTDGKIDVLGKQKGSKSKAAESLRLAKDKIAIGQMLKDAMKSREGKKAATVGLVALGSFILGQTGVSESAEKVISEMPMLFALSAIYVLDTTGAGLEKRNSARSRAMKELLGEFKEEIEKGRHIPLSKAYLRYREKLVSVDMGEVFVKNVSPLSREQFIKALYVWESKVFPLE